MTIPKALSIGDWRRRIGSRTDAHLYGTGSPLPLCGKRIPRKATGRTQSGRPCSDCLVNAIGRRDYGRAEP